MRALLSGCQRRFAVSCGSHRRGIGSSTGSGPLAGMRAFVRGFGAVVEAEGVFAGFTAEGEEVELVAVGVLAVGAYSVEVFVHSGEGLRVRGRGGVG